MLYRKRWEARHVHEHGMFARFRYNDLAAGDCGGGGLTADPDLVAMGIESFFAYNLLILRGLQKSEESEKRS